MPTRIPRYQPLGPPSVYTYPGLSDDYGEYEKPAIVKNQRVYDCADKIYKIFKETGSFQVWDIFNKCSADYTQDEIHQGFAIAYANAFPKP